MSQDPLVLGIDLGTSGVRIAVIDSSCSLLQTESAPYQIGSDQPFRLARALLHVDRSPQA